jgi:hypothetical protein
MIDQYRYIRGGFFHQWENLGHAQLMMAAAQYRPRNLANNQEIPLQNE